VTVICIMSKEVTTEDLQPKHFQAKGLL